MIDYDSSEEDEKESQSGNEEKENQTSASSNPTTQSNTNIGSNIPSHGSVSFHDSKHCTMWIGNDDGR